jgi:hypothetical protein
MRADLSALPIFLMWWCFCVELDFSGDRILSVISVIRAPSIHTESTRFGAEGSTHDPYALYLREYCGVCDRTFSSEATLHFHMQHY